VTSAAGIVVVDKPPGLTSHDVVARCRRLAETRKVGHAGTLDPMATGVLVVGVNRATRLLGHLALTDKEYAATVRLGVSTTTDDAEGQLREQTSAGHLTVEVISGAARHLVGDIDQVPSAVSAIKVDGKRSYARVRAGEDVVLASRQVHVERLDVANARTDGEQVDVDITVVCSSGTYVRALARDLGAALGVGGHLTTLRRSRVGGFDLAVARTLDQLAESFTMTSIDDAARSAFATYELDATEAAAVRFGRPLTGIDLGRTGPVALFDRGEFLALYEQRGKQARPVAVFVG